LFSKRADKKLKNLIKRYLNKLNTIKSNPEEDSFTEIDLEAKSIISKVQNYTMTSVERRFALINAVRYIASNQIAGDIVECGVWKGGSMMAVAYTLIEMADLNRNLYLFDTFEGMTEPSHHDSKKAHRWWNTVGSCIASIDEVKKEFTNHLVLDDRVKFVKGDITQTLLNDINVPDKISILRLDTDWYESTKLELEILYKNLVSGGFLIIDDY
jgi:hypothetical protein